MSWRTLDRKQALSSTWFTLKCLFKLVLSSSILSSVPLLAFLAGADNRAPANNVQGHRSCSHHGMPWQSIRLKTLDMLLSRKPFSFPATGQLFLTKSSKFTIKVESNCQLTCQNWHHNDITTCRKTRHTWHASCHCRPRSHAVMAAL